MENYIPSEYYRNFCEGNNITFTDREIAVMLRNNTRLPLLTKIAALKKLASETKDEVLKSDITAWEEFTNELLKRMRVHRRGEAFYSVSCIYGASTGNIFDSLESALKWLENHPDEFGEHIIAKQGYFSEGTSELEYDCAVEINRAREIVSVYEPYDVKPTVVEKNEFIPFANPFERGDIVRDSRNGNVGVVETEREDWMEFLNDCEKANIPYNSVLKDIPDNNGVKIRSAVFSKRKHKRFNFSLSGLDIVFAEKNSLSRSGTINKEIVQPIYLEKLTENELRALLEFDKNIITNNEMICRISDLFCYRIGLAAFSKVLIQWSIQKKYGKYGDICV